MRSGMAALARSDPNSSRNSKSEPNTSPLHDVINHATEPKSDAKLDVRMSTARWRAEMSGGAGRDRTDDLMLAKHALSRLSYGPCFVRPHAPAGLAQLCAAAVRPCEASRLRPPPRPSLELPAEGRKRERAPRTFARQPRPRTRPPAIEDQLKMVGLGRLERPTSPLSGVRSNHLSYRPGDPKAPRQLLGTTKGSSEKKEKRRRRHPANRVLTGPLCSK